MIHWYTCIEFVITACFATLVFMVWWACRAEDCELNDAYNQGYQAGRTNGEDAWKTRNGFTFDDGTKNDGSASQGMITYQARVFYERPF